MSLMKKIIIVLAVLILGLFSLLRPATLQPETALRNQTLRRSFSPAGSMANQTGGSSVEGGSYTYDPVSPFVVNFAHIDPDAPHTDTMYERWLRGEIDLDENESILSAAEVAELQAAAMRMGVTTGVQIAQSGPALNAPVPTGISFASIDYNGGGGSTPPDPEMAVGPNHIIVVVNVAVAIYNKSGVTLLGPVAAGSLYSGPNCTSGLYDPNVLYDEEADRFIIAFDKGAFSASGGYCLLASQTGDPMGTWNEYFFPLNSSGGWLDYPHAGVGDNFIFMGGNIFSLGGSFLEGRIYAFNKAGLYSGSPVTAIARGLTSVYDTPQPINLHGASTGTWPSWGNKHYFMAEPYDGINYTLFEWDTAALTNLGSFPIGNGGYPVDVSQNGGQNIQANDWRPLDFEYRNGYGWMTATNSCNPGGGTVNCLLWAQIDLVTLVLGPAGSGLYGSSGEHRFFPDLAVNHCNDMAIGYTKSSLNMWPSVFVTGRESGDPVGQLQAEIQMKAGEIAYTAFDSVPRRWGDYTGMTIDPDGLTFWYLGEYSKITNNANGRWGNYIASFNYPGCSVGGDPSIVLTKTVGIEAGVCADTKEITVETGTEVSYCFTITNDGDVTFDTHDLVDSDLGQILNGFSYPLLPGESTFTIESKTIMATTVNSATWTAYGALNAEAASVDTATVTVLTPTIFVSFPDAVLSQLESSIEEYLLNIQNFGDGPLIWALSDGETQIQSNCDTLEDIPWFILAPTSGTVLAGESMDVTVSVDTIGLTGGQTYEAMLCVTSNDPIYPLVEVPVELTVLPYVYALTISENLSTSGEIGTSVTYTVSITNTGNTTGGYDLAVDGPWNFSLSAAEISLQLGEMKQVLVTVDIPLNVLNGAPSVTTLTAVSQNNPSVTYSVKLTTTAVVPINNLYLPFIRKP
jgi:hypothetical protein